MSNNQSKIQIPVGRLISDLSSILKNHWTPLLALNAVFIVASFFLGTVVPMFELFVYIILIDFGLIASYLAIASLFYRQQIWVVGTAKQIFQTPTLIGSVHISVLRFLMMFSILIALLMLGSMINFLLVLIPVWLLVFNALTMFSHCCFVFEGQRGMEAIRNSAKMVAARFWPACGFFILITAIQTVLMLSLVSLFVPELQTLVETSSNLEDLAAILQNSQVEFKTRSAQYLVLVLLQPIQAPLWFLLYLRYRKLEVATAMSVFQGHFKESYSELMDPEFMKAMQEERSQAESDEDTQSNSMRDSKGESGLRNTTLENDGNTSTLQEVEPKHVSEPSALTDSTKEPDSLTKDGKATEEESPTESSEPLHKDESERTSPKVMDQPQEPDSGEEPKATHSENQTSSSQALETSGPSETKSVPSEHTEPQPRGDSTEEGSKPEPTSEQKTEGKQ